MIEILFSESACAGLKIAQHYGEGEYSGGIPGLLFYDDDGPTSPTPEELQAAQREVGENARLKWERAIPMGGNTQDIFEFDLQLSVGDISNENFMDKRRNTKIDLINCVWLDTDITNITTVSKLEKTLKMVLSRAMNGEDLRIWYSNNPDEMCGLYWFMTELQPYEKQLGDVYIVKLPAHENRDNCVIIRNSWSEMDSGDWGRYVTLAETTTSYSRSYYAEQWADLQSDNAPLRVVLNGRLVSAPDTIYDYYICNELAKAKNEFNEWKIIGNLVGTYQLGVPDSWFHLRIEKMICDGKLTVVKGPIEDCPVDSRVLRKVNIDA